MTMESPTRHSADPVVFIGSYTKQGRDAQGVHVYWLDMASGALRLENAADAGPNPSYLALDPTQQYLYAVNEVTRLGDQPGGGITALRVDRTTHSLTTLNTQLTQGELPCYVSVDQRGRFALISNYLTGSIAMYPIETDGRLGSASDWVQHHGSSANPHRQEGPHAHSIVVDPTNRFALVADLGMDKIVTYRLDFENGKLVPYAETVAHPGAGPRHLVFHPNGRYAYLIQEINNTFTAYAYHGDDGTLKELQTVPTLPGDFRGESTAADIHVSPSGQYLYGSNRGHDSIVIYAINPNSGKLAFVGHEPAGGRKPRNFAIDPTGTYLLVANQDSDNVVTYRIEASSGKLSSTGYTAQVSAPVCLKFTNP